MNRMPLLFIGIFLCFASAWLGLIVIPYFNLGRLQPVVDADTKAVYPPPLSGLALEGHRVYAAEGCIYCHSQQVRPADGGSDIARGWGIRRTVARDYINEKPVFLGTSRTGPDLTNIGRRWGSDGAAVAKHHVHLYAPESMNPGTIMPSFSFLYEVRKITGQPSVDALKLPPAYAPVPGYEVVPTAEAKALVAYLISLDRSYPLPEAPEK